MSLPDHHHHGKMKFIFQSLCLS